LKDEDKFILSKGHCSYPLYILLREKGYNPKISTHPDIDVENGIYCTTGSLGHGLPIGVGTMYSVPAIGVKVRLITYQILIIGYS
jgi:transketolase